MIERESSGHRRLFQIAGLDPAGPLFRGLNSTSRLDKMDADFVEVTHTSSLLGLQESIGHVDIYYNGGQFQRGCILSSKFLISNIKLLNQNSSFFMRQG